MNEALAAIGRTIVGQFSDLRDVTEMTRVTVPADRRGARRHPRLRARTEGQGGRRPYGHAGVARFCGVRDDAAARGVSNADPTRVMQGVISGIGFLGAGATLKRSEGEGISGPTTAGGIWMTAAIGMAAGLGRDATAVLSTLVALCTFALGSATFEWLGRRRRARRDASPDEVR